MCVNLFAISLKSWSLFIDVLSALSICFHVAFHSLEQIALSLLGFYLYFRRYVIDLSHIFFSELIQAFRETNSQLPKRIIFFRLVFFNGTFFVLSVVSNMCLFFQYSFVFNRDGVAGTQFCDVLQHEVPNIRKVWHWWSLFNWGWDNF